jgi:hypothetical protein
MITKAEVVEWLYRLLEEAKQLSWAYTGELGQSLRASPEYVTFESTKTRKPQSGLLY